MAEKRSARACTHLTRRSAIGAVGLGVAGLLLGACSGPTNKGADDFSARFSRFEPAAEPNADPARVVWPSFVLEAGPDVRRLYEYQLQNGDLMRYIPCFCGCKDGSHRNNRDCYIKQVNPDGGVVFDSMAPT